MRAGAARTDGLAANRVLDLVAAVRLLPPAHLAPNLHHPLSFSDLFLKTMAAIEDQAKPFAAKHLPPPEEFFARKVALISGTFIAASLRRVTAHAQPARQLRYHWPGWFLLVRV